LFEEFVRSDAVYNIVPDAEDGDKVEVLEKSSSFSGSEDDSIPVEADDFMVDDERLVHRIMVDKVTPVNERNYNETTILYQITCSGKGHSWKIFRRFKQIAELDSALRADFKTIQIPKLPSRKSKFIADHKDPRFLEKRRILVQNYLRLINSQPEIYSSDVFLTFLGVPGFSD
jgi:hypothetical protein